MGCRLPCLCRVKPKKTVLFVKIVHRSLNSCMYSLNYNIVPDNAFVDKFVNT